MAYSQQINDAKKNRRDEFEEKSGKKRAKGK
jgi:hypothetical protein